MALWGKSGAMIDACMYTLTDDDLHTDAIIIITYSSQCTSNSAAT